MTPDDVFVPIEAEADYTLSLFYEDQKHMVVWTLDENYPRLRGDVMPTRQNRIAICIKCQRQNYVWQSGICLTCRPRDEDWEDQLRRRRADHGSELPLAPDSAAEVQ